MVPSVQAVRHMEDYVCVVNPQTPLASLDAKKIKTMVAYKARPGVDVRSSSGRCHTVYK